MLKTFTRESAIAVKTVRTSEQLAQFELRDELNSTL